MAVCYHVVAASVLHREIMMSKPPFSSLPLSVPMLDNIASLGFESMTPIQAQSLPAVLDAKDVIAQGKTGSGKTVAFALGVLHHLRVKRYRVQSLVLCPTRELADQVATEMRRLARCIHNIKILTLCGGMPFGPQIGSLEHGAHIVVGTPGRVQEHLRKGFLSLAEVGMFVLDEADRMLDMGFQESLDAIIASLPVKRQTLLFSATYPERIQAIATRIMRNPLMVKVESQHKSHTISQRFYHVDNDKDRLSALRILLLKHQCDSTLVFCNTKREAQAIANDLCEEGFSALAIHGDLEQRDRTKTLVRFSNKSVSILVATDVAARGLDIDSLDAVINYHVARDSEVHVHRIGRTGRAGKVGIACSLYSDKEDYKIALLGDYLGKRIEGDKLPSSAVLKQAPSSPAMITLQIDAGKKQKLRPGDILGALTAEGGIAGKQVGKINVFDQTAFVAVYKTAVKPALRQLTERKMKGRQFRARIIKESSAG